MSQRTKLLVLSLVWMTGFGIQEARGADLRVPDEYKTLTEALRAVASEGDRIVVTDGKEYVEGLSIEKSVALVSDPPGAQLRSSGGSGLTIRGKGIRVVIQGLIITACPENGILVEPGEGDAVHLELVNTTVRDNGKSGILVRSGKGNRIRLNRGTKITGNKGPGIRSYVPVHLTGEGAEVSNNVADGIRLSPPEEKEVPTSEFLQNPSPDPSEVVLRSCRMDDNQGNGVSVSNGMSANLLIEDCHFERNGQSGFAFDQAFGCRVVLRMASSFLIKNRDHGILSFKPVQIDLTKVEMADHRFSGVHVACKENSPDPKKRNESSIRVSNCRAERNSHGFVMALNTGGTIDMADSYIAENPAGGVYVALNEGYSAQLNMKRCEVKNNGQNGVGLHVSGDGNKAVFSEGCVFSGNKWAGILTRNVQDFVMDNCRVEGNASGIAVYLDKDATAGPSSMTLSHCEILGQKNSGITIERRPTSKCNMRLVASNCAIKGSLVNGVHTYNGIYGDLEMRFDNVDIEKSGAAGIKATDNGVSITLQNSTVSENGGPGLMLFNPTLFKAVDTKISENAWRGIEIRSLKSIVVKNVEGRTGRIDLVRCAIQSNKGPGLCVQDKNNAIVSCVDTVIEGNSNGIWLAPSPGFAEKIALENTKIRNNSERGICINAPFLLASGKGSNSAPWSSPMPVYLMSSQFALGLKGSAIENNAGGDIGPHRTDGEILWVDSNVFADLASDWDGFVPLARLAESRSPAGATEKASRTTLVDSYRRYQAVSNLLALARAFHVVGSTEDSDRCAALARKVLAVLFPSVSESDLPEGVRSLLKRTESELARVPETSLERVLQMDAETTQSVEERRRLVESRLEDYYSIFFRTGENSFPPELAYDYRPSALRDTAIQLYLNDLVKILSSKAPPLVVTEYARTLTQGDRGVKIIEGEMRDLFSFLSSQERGAIMDWLSKEGDPAAASAGASGAEYYSQMTRICQFLEDKTRETHYLEAFAGTESPREAKVKVLEQLIALYQDYWKLPEKANGCRQRIADLSKGTTDEYQAKLGIAKSLYEGRKYDEAVFELTKLLEHLPSTVNKDPIRTMLGMSYLGGGNMEAARNEFAQVINSDQGEYREKCLYLLGYAYVSEQKYPEAVKPFRDLVNLYPKGQFAARAKDFLSKIDTTPGSSQ